MITNKKLAKILVAVGMLNFVVFIVVAIAIGGDALNGHEANGHYYLNSHGTDTEVSRIVFMYSKVHAMSVFITHPLALIGGAILTMRRIRGA
jgi:hypothetical protein